MDGRRIRALTATAVAGVLTVALASLGSAQGDASGDATVPMYKGTPGRTGEMAGPVPMAPVGTLWSIQTEGLVKSNPAVAGDRVVIVGGDTHVLALDPATGEQRWASADGRYVGSPAVSAEHAFAATEDGALVALALDDGSIRWQAPGALGPLVAPLLADEHVVVGGMDGSLRAFDAATGVERWSAEVGGEVTTRGPAADGGRVFVGTSDGYLNAVDLATGELVWSWAFPSACCATTAARDGVVVAAGGGEGDTGLLVAFDAATGQERWRYVPEDGAGLRSPSMSATSVYVKAAGGTMVSLATETGELQWTAPVEPHETPIVIVDSTLLVVGPPDAVTAVDAATGDIGWTASLGGEVTGGISVVDGRILAGTANGRIVALGTVDAPAPSPSAAADAVREARIVRTLDAPDGFSTVIDVAFDAQGSAWATEGVGGRIAIFSPDGEFIEHWGQPGSGPGQFDFVVPGSVDPTGAIAFLPDGGFWISDPGNYRLQRFDAERNWVMSVGHFGDGDGQFLGQTYLSRAEDGTLWVTDVQRGDIQAFTPDGAYLRTIPKDALGDGSLSAWHALAYDGRLWVAACAGKCGTISVLEMDGTPVASIRSPRLIDAGDLAVAPDGRIHVADWGHYLHVLDPETLSIVGSWQVLRDGVASEPNGLAVAPDGRTWVAEWKLDVIDIVELP